MLKKIEFQWTISTSEWTRGINPFFISLSCELLNLSERGFWYEFWELMTFHFRSFTHLSSTLEMTLNVNSLQFQYPFRFMNQPSAAECHAILRYVINQCRLVPSGSFLHINIRTANWASDLHAIFNTFIKYNDFFFAIFSSSNPRNK